MSAKNKAWEVILCSDWRVKQWNNVEEDRVKFANYKNFSIWTSGFAYMFQLFDDPKLIKLFNKFKANTLQEVDIIYRALLLAMRQWFERVNYKSSDNDDYEWTYNNFLICTKTKIWEVTHLGEICERKDYAAIGSWQTHALGALDICYNAFTYIDTELIPILKTITEQTARRDTTVGNTFYYVKVWNAPFKDDNNKLKETKLPSVNNRPVRSKGDIHWWSVPWPRAKQKWRRPKLRGTYRNVWRLGGRQG